MGFATRNPSYGAHGEAGFALFFPLRKKVPEELAPDLIRGRMRGNGASTPELAAHHRTTHLP